MTDAQQPPVHGPVEALAQVRDYVAAIVASTASPGSRLNRSNSAAKVPSATVDGATVWLSVRDDDPSFLGTFDRTSDTRLITVTLMTMLDTSPGHDGGSSRQIDIPYDEQIHWVRAVLGELTDYAYKVVSDSGRYRVRPAVFVVLVQGDGRPALAPSDFEWLLVVGGRRAYPEKVIPRDPELLRYLRYNGDLVAASSILHPDAAAPAVWAQQFVSALTSAMADELGRLGNDRWFTVEEVSLRGVDRVVVRYIWHMVAGDKYYGFDIDLAGVREQRLSALDDPRASTAGFRFGALPFGQPIFQSERVVDGRHWIDFPT